VIRISGTSLVTRRSQLGALDDAVNACAADAVGSVAYAFVDSTGVDHNRPTLEREHFECDQDRAPTHTEHSVTKAFDLGQQRPLQQHAVISGAEAVRNRIYPRV